MSRNPWNTPQPAVMSTPVALISSTAFSLGGVPASLAVVELGLLVATDHTEPMTLLWADILGAVVMENQLIVYTCAPKASGQRILSKFTISSGQPELLESFAVATRYLARYPWDTTRTLNEILQTETPDRRCLVLINPVGGSGAAERMFQDVRGFFDAAGIHIKIQLTEHAAHATEIAQTLDLTAFDFVVCVGGDGLASEVVQGLIRRSDWHDAIRFPIGLIPGGSGNGLTQSLTKLVNEAFFPENCAYLIVKGSPQPMDMMTARNDHETFLSFLSLAWAFVADVDLESETYRLLGGARFTVSAVAKVLSWKRWHGALSYLPAADDEPTPTQYWDALPASGDAPALDLLPPLAGPLPASWKTIEGPFTFFWATSAAAPSSDCHLAPGAHVNDGYIHVVAVPENLSLVTQAKILLALDSATHLEYPQVVRIKTRAYQLRRTDTNFVSIDGERFGGSTIQVQMHRGLGRVMCLPY
ncbi:sphingosine kinase [Achlya hypogyna]|uniref:Sphingosine kinase n=1 Tax=Achlya hypogyna TaxID=1202772 RepID=A0A1V9Z6Z1_ACHHY|nr:sphingosine kinase [Achlya hypogyna]